MTSKATNPGRSALGRRAASVAAAALLVAGTACDLDLTNPNAPSEDQVITDPNGIIAVAVGMQGQFAQTIDDYMVVNSLVTDEWGTRSVALISYISLFTGENFTEEFGVVYTPWLRTYLVVKSANTVLAGAGDPAIGLELGTNMRAGVSATAKLFKAMALGYAATLYEELPIDITVENPVPQPRDVVLDTVLALLESAREDLETVTDAQLADFRTRVLGSSTNPGIKLRSTIDAMLARYYLMDGQYQAAIDAAERVDLGVLSELRFPTPTRNPINNLAFGLNYVAGLQSFIEEAEAGDDRPAYWLDVEGDTLPANPVNIILRPFLKYSGNNDAFPIYLPDEMKLIQAEAYTRLGGAANFLLAANLINEVRTQTSSGVDEPVASLPAILVASLASEAALLDQIAYERRYELFMQGLRWEDTRRLGTARTVVPTLPWLPIPPQECQTNPGAGC